MRKDEANNGCWCSQASFGGKAKHHRVIRRKVKRHIQKYAPEIEASVRPLK